MDFLLIALLTLLNGAFAMSEMALTASRKALLLAMAEQGDRGAQAALDLIERPTRFLSSVQVGITSIGILNGIVGEAAFSAPLAQQLQQSGLSSAAASISATALVVTLITFVTIVFGELVPKRIGQLYPETVARLMARPMAGLARITHPFVSLLSISTNSVLQLLRVNNAAARQVTEEEIVASLAEGVHAGVIEQHERQMVQNVFHLDDRPLTSLMLPRADIQWLDASWTVAQALTHVSQGEAHSWYPVCRGSLDHVVGVISVATLLRLGAGEQGSTEQHALAAAFVPETLSGMELLEQFRAQSVRMSFVVDEYGVVQGLLTPHDLLEAITGELQSAVPNDAWATQRADGSWLLDGQMPVAEFKSRLAVRELPQEDRGRYNTVAGLVLYLLGHLPTTGEAVDTDDWRLEVVDLDGRRIDKVLASPLGAAAAGGADRDY